MIERYFGINFNPIPNAVLDDIDKAVNDGKAGYVCVVDGNILAMTHKDSDYLEVIDGSMFSIMDSSWIPVYVKLIYGKRYPQYNGSMIFDDITRMRKYNMCFLGASNDILVPLKEKMTNVDPAIGGMEFMELPFCKVDEFDYKSIADAINAKNPDIVWLSLGAPKQEQFTGRLCRYLNRGVVIPVGAVFKFRSGTGEKRAPRWMIKCHLEFVYRLFSDPGKQIRRCLTILGTLPGIFFKELKRSKNK